MYAADSLSTDDSDLVKATPQASQPDDFREAHCGHALVVEDDEDIRSLVAAVVASDGFEAEVASNGREALEEIQRHGPPDVILLDLMMPVMTGLEFLDVVRKDPRLAKLPVIVVSAFDKLAASAAGATGFLKKPVSVDELLAVVRRYCRGSA